MSTALLADITPGTVRAWRAHLLSDGISETMAAKAYRLLRAVLNTAVDDELIRRNPCRIKKAGQGNRPPSGLPPPSNRYSHWPASSPAATAPWSCSPHSPASATANSPHSGGATST